MKRLIVTLAAVAIVAPLGAATSVDAQPRWERGERWERREGQWERREERWERGGKRPGDWNRSRHNGYYHHKRWHYGPPPAAHAGDPDYRPGYHAWRRGAALPPSYRGRVVTDYDRYRLRPPPRGYAWHRVDDAFLLMGVDSGVIFEIVPD